eukprot:13753344-Heterocapsa_arctica.AAC.1
MINDFSTGMRRSVIKQDDDMKWVRSIGVRRLANTPDVLATDKIFRLTQLWSASERNAIHYQQ